MSDKKINPENNLKERMVGHAKKNRLMLKMMSDLDSFEQKVQVIVHQIEKHRSEENPNNTSNSSD